MTASIENKIPDINNKMRSEDLELSSLVGREILIMSSKFENKSLYSKVVMVYDNIISLDRGGEDKKITQIDNHQEVVVQFNYRGQRLSAKAKIYMTASGRYNVILNDAVIPLNRRMFKRYPLNCQVRCAILPLLRIVESDMAKLRWLEVKALNLSSGGILLPIPSKITNDTILLLNIDYDNPYLPNLIIAQVKHSQPIDRFNYHVGTQFILNEQKENIFSPLKLKKIPTKAFDYTIKIRNRFDKSLAKELSITEE